MSFCSLSHEHARTALPIETSQLKALRERLSRAQHAEITANRELNEFSAKSDRNNGEAFAELLASVQAAREKTKALYAEWVRTVDTFDRAPSTLCA